MPFSGSPAGRPVESFSRTLHQTTETQIRLPCRVRLDAKSLICHVLAFTGIDHLTWLTRRTHRAQHLFEEAELREMAHTLEAEVLQARSLREVRKKDLHSGDRVLVTTRNSRYMIWVLDEGQYRVSGGWFDLNGRSPERVAINGCTWGGSAIKSDVVAAHGLHLEFGNTVLTTRIRDICVIPARAQFVPN